MDLNKRQYDLGPTDRWEYPNYFGDIKAGLSWFTLEIYYWLIYAPPLLHVFVYFYSPNRFLYIAPWALNNY